MDRQIIACDMQCEPLDPTNHYYVVNASSMAGRVHIYDIDNLCKELHKPYRVEKHSDAYDCHYFFYKKHKFYGLVTRKETDNERK